MRTFNLAACMVLAAAAVMGPAGCKRSTPKATSVATADRAAVPAVLSEAERLYGVSPRRAPGVTYQPDVILMEHGANAIRSQSVDGFTWTIDAAAPGAADIRPDKILFATGRVVGRVLKVTTKGGDLDVTLGPAELTDIFQEVHIATEGSLDPEKMLVYVAPAGYPGASHDRDEPEAPAAALGPDLRHSGVQVYAVSQAGDMVPLHPGARTPRRTACGNDAWGEFHVMQASYVSRPETIADGADDCAQFTRAGVGTTAAAIADVVLDGFSITPSMAGGLQAATKYNHGGLIFNAHTKIRLDHPKFKFRLDILHGLKTAAIEFSGVGGIEVGIEAGTSDALKNINREFAVPVDISYPIPGLVPFAATFHQSLLVQTLFTAKQGTLRTQGDFSVSGTITAGIVDGAPTATAPLTVTSNTSLTAELSGESLGVNGLVLGYGGKLIIGLGSFGLIVGPYASINTALGITRGSDLATGLVAYTCRSSTLDLFIDYGLGFAIPSWSAKAVNAFLGLFGAKPISTSYGTKLGTLPITKIDESLPPSCAAKPT